MPALDLAALRAAPLIRQPFDYLVLPGFVRPEARAAVNADFPRIDQPGSFPVGAVTYGPAFRDLLEALTGPEVQEAFEEKFQIELKKRPTMVTVRGRCGPKDGNIHTDAASKLITVLIYLNPQWEETGGRLRLLRSATDIDDVLVEVPPAEGTLIAFRRSRNSFHGHKPFTGPRRVIQLNWVTDRLTVRREVLRHRISAWMKRVLRRSGQAPAMPS
jgi:SM-20-related protein